jgi:hypothetical protein
MAVVEAETSVRDQLTRLHPLIQIALKHGARVDDEAGARILGKVEAWICELLHREPHLDPGSLGITVHTRLRELMADAQLFRDGKETGDGEKKEATKEAEEADASGATSCLEESLATEIETVTAARRQAVREILEGAKGRTADFIKLYVGEGLPDLEIARRLGIASDDMERMKEDLLARLESAWLSADPSMDSPHEAPPCFDSTWFYHFVTYVRGKLDPDRKNYIEGHAFRCVRCGARLGGLQMIIDQIRSGSWTGDAERPAAAKVRRRGSTGGMILGAVAVIIVGTLSAFLVQSSVGPDGGQSTTSEISVLQPVEIPEDMSLPEGARHTATLSATIRAYKQRDYARAAEGWERLHAGGARVSNLTLYLGVSQLLAGRAGRAVVTLAREVPFGPEGIPYYFYRAQSLLVLGRVEEAREELRRVLALGESDYREQAEIQLTALLSPPRAGR